MSIKQRALSIALIIITAMALVYFLAPSERIWGAGEEPYMVIAGKKPSDAKISVQVNYFGRGESCSGWSWNAGSGKVNTGNYNEHFTIEHNFSKDEDFYELRIPYQPRQPETNCITHLSNMEVKLTNEFDTVGFANLRINQAGNDYYNKPTELTSKLEARDCNSYLYQWSKDIWKGITGCYYVIDNKMLSQESQTNAQSVYFDFSQFNSDTVIHYDILPGEEYRSTSLDPQTGK
ncbi:hypothetical protein [Vibrio sp. TRT 17S01]|uniref:hypothetical protein n=1 Tax=Vibrio sp. TRT 17S01 TaxID=3418505 RepID=UPI003CF75A04